jgi:tetratricopeptide (TPR) repeat protein
MVVAAGLGFLWDRLRTRVRPLPLLAVPVGLLIVFAAMTSRQARVWTNSETLFRHTLVELGDDPYRWDIHWRLGKHYFLEGRVPEAIAEFDQTLALNPNEPQSLYLKGIGLLQLGERALQKQQPRQTVDEFFLAAADLLDRSAAILPTPEPLGAAGFAYAHLNRLPLAEDRLVRGLQQSPGDIRMRLGLGMVLSRQGRTTEARELLERTIQDVPELAAQREQILKSWEGFTPGPARQ